MSARRAEGPYFDELEVGQVFDRAPRHTLTAGRQAVHQSIVGDRLRLALDDELARRVAGGPVAHPALVWDVAIGQSTVVTQQVKANLFYRDLAFRRMPLIGDTMHTVSTVVGLRENARREGRAPTGLVALHLRTADQHDRTVLDFYRCAMLPLRDAAPTGRADDLDGIGRAGNDWASAMTGLDLSALPQGDRVPAAGTVIDVAGGDVVSSAPELARLTLNLASVHHDAAGAGRLVYGGHTIGIALSQTGRALPDLVTVLGWHGCDHVGPVREGDTLHSAVEVERIEAGASGTTIAHIRTRVHAAVDRPVLDWRFVGLFA